MFIQSGEERCQTLGSTEQKDEILNTQAATREVLTRSDEESFHKDWLSTGICAPTGYEEMLEAWATEQDLELLYLILRLHLTSKVPLL